jgi:hypothetical protein
MMPAFSKTYKHIFMSFSMLAQSQMSLAGHKMPLARFGPSLPKASHGRGGTVDV